MRVHYGFPNRDHDLLLICIVTFFLKGPTFNFLHDVLTVGSHAHIGIKNTSKV